MKCPECNGRGETIYYVETERDENTVTVEQRKGICRSCNGSGEQTMTNADRIRAMTDEELAVSLAKTVIDAMLHAHNMSEASSEVPTEIIENLATEYMEWLKQPTEE